MFFQYSNKHLAEHTGFPSRIYKGLNVTCSDCRKTRTEALVAVKAAFNSFNLRFPSLRIFRPLLNPQWGAFNTANIAIVKLLHKVLDFDYCQSLNLFFFSPRATFPPNFALTKLNSTNADEKITLQMQQATQTTAEHTCACVHICVNAQKPMLIITDTNTYISRYTRRSRKTSKMTRRTHPCFHRCWRRRANRFRWLLYNTHAKQQINIHLSLHTSHTVV